MYTYIYIIYRLNNFYYRDRKAGKEGGKVADVKKAEDMEGYQGDKDVTELLKVSVKMLRPGFVVKVVQFLNKWTITRDPGIT